MPTTPHTSRRPGRRTAFFVVGIMMLSLTTAAAAQDSHGISVSMSVTGDGSRNLRVTEPTGVEDLESLTLVAGVPSAYRATVTDTNYSIGVDFDVLTEMNNLYPVNDASVPTVHADSSNIIPSGNVTLGTLQGLSLGDILADLDPGYILSLDPITECSTTLGGLGLPVVGTALTTLCGAVSDVVAAGGIDDLELPAAPITGLDLNALGLVDDVLGIVDGIAPGALNAESFGDPSYLGLGADDPVVPTLDPMYSPTYVTLMSAVMPTDLTDLLAALTDQLPAVAGDVVATVGANAVVQGLLNSGDVATAALGQAIADLNNATQIAQVIDTLFSIVNGVVDISWLQNLTGIYTAFPQLTATPPGGLPGGSYAGTHTVTLVSR